MELFTLDAVLNLESDGFMNGVSLAKDAMLELTALADAGPIFDAAMSGAEAGASALEVMLDKTSLAAAGRLEAALTGAGTRAASAVADSLESALNGLSIALNVRPGATAPGGVQRNARAMNSGRIFNNPTVFAYADGAYQMAGDGGAEAVVGVSSLYGMIDSAVRGAMSNFQPDSGQKTLNIVMELDHRAVAQGVYRLNREETQRVGVSFSDARS